MSKENFLVFIKSFVNTAKEKIVELATTELNNQDKKKKLDEAIITFLELNVERYNVFVRLAIKKLIIPNVDNVTQLIYDLLKAKIKGVTDDNETQKSKKSTKNQNEGVQA